mmetsp:Transcript_4795/g.30407  ORF Transcript_4795/g.30407 Transcript_4795/m.30407 type:complete len:327 (-) Transcript_4795:593-1573(-)
MDGTFHQSTQDPMNLFHTPFRGTLEQSQTALDQTTVSHFRGNQVRLVPIRFVDDLGDVLQRVELLEGQVSNILHQLLLKSFQNALSTPSSTVQKVSKLPLKCAAQLQHHVQHGTSVAGDVHPEIFKLAMQINHTVIEVGLNLRELPQDGLFEVIDHLVGKVGRPDVLEVGVFAVLEEFFFLSPGFFHVYLTVDVCLRSIDDPNPSVLEHAGPPIQYVQGVGSAIHDVQLGQHPDGAIPIRIHSPGHADGIRGCNVRVGRGHGQYDDVVSFHEVHHHVVDVLDDAFRLSFDGYFGEPWHVHQGERGHVLRMHGQLDGFWRDGFAGPQ